MQMEIVDSWTRTRTRIEISWRFNGFNTKTFLRTQRVQGHYKGGGTWKGTTTKTARVGLARSARQHRQRAERLPTPSKRGGPPPPPDEEGGRVALLPTTAEVASWSSFHRFRTRTAVRDRFRLSTTTRPRARSCTWPCSWRWPTTGSCPSSPPGGGRRAVAGRPLVSRHHTTIPSEEVPVNHLVRGGPRQPTSRQTPGVSLSRVGLFKNNVCHSRKTSKRVLDPRISASTAISPRPS